MRKEGRKLHKDVALQPSSDRGKTNQPESNWGKKGHKQVDQLFLSELTQCHALANPTTYADDSLDIAKLSNTHSNSHCSHFHLSTWQYKPSILSSKIQSSIFSYQGICRHLKSCHGIYCCLPKHLMVFHAKGHFCFIAAVISMWTAMQLKITCAIVFSYQSLFSGLHTVPYSQCCPLFPFCSTHFWHQMGPSSHQLSIPERQESICY